MEDKQSLYICFQAVGIVFGFIFVNDVVNERWFDVGLMFVVMAILLVAVAKMSKIE
ncbi:hypothetical protein HWV01_09755 [Moritella sp. 5]|uniref:hypothetical protein n=1 Tax=Moritella sp. 5 TaxID=2746231 RepID=UPI001BACB311|nr:hypothetical protein [Moritella sp. 5]QUM80545.1 hypothetical protein HWV01_09755 [Moritella sp. 5]